MFAPIVRRLQTVGLNVSGVADGAPYQHVLKDCASVLVVGSGGPAMWHHFVEAVRREPEWLMREHPLDDWLEEQLPPVSGARWLRCAATETLHVDFRKLAIEAGLGWNSATGLVLNGEHGLWVGLRAALFSPDAWDCDGPLQEQSPCVGCERPCEAACPVGAVVGGHWDHARCRSRQESDSDGCGRACAVRVACPVGRPSVYPIEAQHYHHRPSAERLRRAVGVAR